MDKYVKVDKNNMFDYFRQTKEFIFLDEILIIPGKSATAKKYISKEEWYFKYHFPNNPIMPGVFQMEAMMQTGGLIINTLEGKRDLKILFDSAKNVKIISMIKPEMILTTDVKIISYKRGIIKLQGEVKVEDKLMSNMEFTLVAPDELIRI